MKRQKYIAGVSLVELMVVLGMIAILASLAVPAWRSAIARDQVSTTANKFLRTIRNARNAAQDRQVAVNIIANAAPANNEWGNGWQILTANPVPVLIMNFDPIPPSIRLDAANPVDTTISFANNGIRNGVGNSIFTVCDATDNTIPGRQIQVNVLGRVQITDRNFACP